MNKIEGIVLAAGFSERAMTFKPALTIGNKTIIEHCVDGMLSVCQRVIVVGGYKIEIIREILAPYKKVEVLYNEQYKSGMFFSVKKGVSAITSEDFFLIPGDQPLIKEETYQEMLKIEADIVIPKYKEKKGHPVLFKNEMKKGILAMPDDATLRDFIHRENFTCIEVDDHGILLDVDTQQDYEKISSIFKEVH